MKAAMSGFDLRAISRELDEFSGAYVKKAYMPHYEQIVLRINPKESPQFDLVLVRGARIYTSNRDRPMPMTPPPFAMVLRKHLKNARMTKVRQLGFDRVLAFDFDTKFGERHLYVEVFRDGNIILTDEEDVIIQPLTHASYAGRTLKKGVQYQPPPQALDPYELDIEALEGMFEKSDRDLVSTLGGKANLGGTHANAVCELAGVKPNSETKGVSSEEILSALHSLLDDLANSRQGYLMLKPSEEFDEKGLKEHISTLENNSIRDRFLETHANEATPTLLPSHSSMVKMEFDSLCKAVDAWKGAHDAGALARREAEKLDVAAPGRGHSTDVERLERRKAQQEKALEGFSVKIEKQQMLGHLIQDNWTHVESLLNQISEAVEKNGWKETKKASKEIKWIVSMDAAKRTFVTILPDENSQPNGPKVTLSLDETVHQNAQRHFETARKQKDKTKGAVEALENTTIELKRANKKEKKAEESGKIGKIKRSKRLWFENHRWSMTSGGHLLVGGKDAKGNDAIVKKHLSGQDMYLHADIHGAPSCSLRASQGFIIDEHRPAHIPEYIPAFKLVDKLGDERINDDKLLEAATMSLCWSRAWASGGGHGTVYSVKPAQVSKTAQTGEYVGKGAFIIRGKRQWYKDLDVKMGIGLVSINGVPLLMSGTPDRIKSICQRYAIISPGISKKDKLANRIYKNTGLMTDDILSVLPGSSEIIEDKGIFSKIKEKIVEEE
ncbi:MAG: fibronectin-binding domain-containing protein [Euryarchaeota archaeon TMED248]|nr:MAG: fibronectin-binding domain-containing protein [Euryarchaeota archaeon TMED248]|tara:strand:+ start:4948 stop:7122 length:2175 start_codon:yes stop_codon:yes gene_type:complete